MRTTLRDSVRLIRGFLLQKGLDSRSFHPPLRCTLLLTSAQRLKDFGSVLSIRVAAGALVAGIPDRVGRRVTDLPN